MKRSRTSAGGGKSAAASDSSSDWVQLRRKRGSEDLSAYQKLVISPCGGYMANIDDEENEIVIQSIAGAVVNAKCPSGGVPGDVRGRLSFKTPVELAFIENGHLAVVDIGRDNASEEGGLHGEVQVIVLSPDASLRVWKLCSKYTLKVQPFAECWFGGIVALSTGSASASELLLSVFIPPEEPSDECRVYTYDMLGNQKHSYDVCWSAGGLDTYLGDVWGEPERRGHNDATLSTLMLVTPPVEEDRRLLIISYVTEDTKPYSKFIHPCGHVYCYDHSSGDLLWNRSVDAESLGRQGCDSLHFALDWARKCVWVHDTVESDGKPSGSSASTRMTGRCLFTGEMLPSSFALPKGCELFACHGDSFVAMGSDGLMTRAATLQPADQEALQRNTYEHWDKEWKGRLVWCTCSEKVDECSALSMGEGLGGGHWARNGVPLLSAYARALGLPRRTLLQHLRHSRCQFYEGFALSEDEKLEIGYDDKAPRVRGGASLATSLHVSAS